MKQQLQSKSLSRATRRCPSHFIVVHALNTSADIHDGRTIGGDSRKPLLYKEWRFEGEVNGTGFFKAGIVAPTKYFLVLQSRGNNCDTAEDFTHWRLKITGNKADYAFYGELSAPVPDKENE
jgi:hypothetical protein